MLLVEHPQHDDTLMSGADRFFPNRSSTTGPLLDDLFARDAVMTVPRVTTFPMQRERKYGRLRDALDFVKGLRLRCSEVLPHLQRHEQIVGLVLDRPGRFCGVMVKGWLVPLVLFSDVHGVRANEQRHVSSPEFEHRAWVLALSEVDGDFRVAPPVAKVGVLRSPTLKCFF